MLGAGFETSQAEHAEDRTGARKRKSERILLAFVHTIVDTLRIIFHGGLEA
jgi:hypothetical protein